MGFEVIVTQLEWHIFKASPTFNHPFINYHNLKLGNWVDIAMGFLFHSFVDKIVSATTINQSYNFAVLDITLKFQGLRC